MSQPSDVFLSYARLSNRDGAVTRLHECLQESLQDWSGDRTLTVFRDVNDIEGGQDWRNRIHHALEDAKVLVAVVTPGFYGSESCREEFRRFCEGESKRRQRYRIHPCKGAVR